MKVKLLSHVRLLATLWTEAYQAPPSMRFSRQEYGKSHFLLQGIFLTQGSNPGPLHYRQMFYHLSHQGSHWQQVIIKSGCDRVRTWSSERPSKQPLRHTANQPRKVKVETVPQAPFRKKTQTHQEKKESWGAESCHSRLLLPSTCRHKLGMMTGQLLITRDLVQGSLSLRTYLLVKTL